MIIIIIIIIILIKDISSQQKLFLTNFVSRNIAGKKTRELTNINLVQATWDLHFNIPYYHLAKEIILCKQNIQTLN